jgi:nicotinic acetylcholine receptor
MALHRAPRLLKEIEDRMKQTKSPMTSSQSFPLWIFFTLASLPIGTLAGPNERRLINDLTANYNKLERPVANESEAVTLKFGLTLQQIMDVDEKNQIITTNIWLNWEWTDVNMRWNESEYGDIKDIRMPPSSLWKPDILMYNSASEAFDGTYPTNVVVTSKGVCTYIPPGIFKSSCQIDITWFPFDDQNCEMKFGSWTYNGFKVFPPPGMRLYTSAVPNPIWTSHL